MGYPFPTSVSSQPSRIHRAAIEATLETLSHADAVSALPHRVATDLLARVDRALPGRVEGFYLVGSACMGAFRPGRSDIDFVAIVGGDLTRRELARLEAVHLGLWISSLARDVVVRRRWPLVCNGIYLRRGDLALPALEVIPIAAHVAGRFRVEQRSGFDVNPVTWQVLADYGVAVRGPHPDSLQIHTDADELRRWSLVNLNDYWCRWSEHTLAFRAPPRRAAAGGVLGAPRLHYTIATGEVTTKERAGRYALAVFDRRWHPLIEDALAFWRGSPPPSRYRRRPMRRHRDATQFVAVVIDAANQLPYA